MKIVQWNSAKCWGGAEVRLTETCEFLKKRGHEIYVICKKNTPLFTWITKSNYSVYTHTPINSADLFNTFLIALRILKWDADIIHVHTGRDYVPAILAGMISNCPVIIHRRLLYPLNVFTRWILKKRKVSFISVSERVTTILTKIDKIPLKKICTIKNAIDPSRIDYKKSEVEKLKQEYNLDGKKVILSIGNLYPSKGHDDLIKSIKFLKKKINDFILLIAGEGSEKKHLESLIEKLGLNNYVKLLGRRDDVSSLLNICDCFVLLSWEDPFPGAIIEALASGKPIIGCNAGGVPEIIKDGKTGFLVPPHNPEKVSDILYKLLLDESTLKIMGINAKKDFNERFNIEIMINKIENLYSKIQIKFG